MRGDEDERAVLLRRVRARRAADAAEGVSYGSPDPSVAAVWASLWPGPLTTD